MARNSHFEIHAKHAARAIEFYAAALANGGAPGAVYFMVRTPAVVAG